MEALSVQELKQIKSALISALSEVAPFGDEAQRILQELDHVDQLIENKEVHHGRSETELKARRKSSRIMALLAHLLDTE